MSIFNVLIVLLVLSLLGVLPTWGYSHSWGYGPSGMLVLAIIVLVALTSTGRLRS